MLKSIALLFTFFERFIGVADKAVTIAENVVDVGVAHSDHFKSTSLLELSKQLTQAERAAAASVN